MSITEPVQNLSWLVPVILLGVVAIAVFCVGLCYVRWVELFMSSMFHTSFAFQLENNDQWEYCIKRVCCSDCMILEYETGSRKLYIKVAKL